MHWNDFVQAQLDGGAVGIMAAARPHVARYASLEAEWRALHVGPALVDRSYRALLEVTGADRATWLHNLTTNQVKNLGCGEGNYAFVLNIQGRILFDVNLLVRADSIWVDLDRRFLETAKKHFSKYCITENVTVVDRSDEFVRFGLVGAKAASLLGELGAANAAAMPQLNQATIELPIADQSRERKFADTNPDPNRPPQADQGAVHAAATVIRSISVAVLIVRHDFCGPFAVELFVPAVRAAELWNVFVDHHHAIPAGNDAVQVRRIEAGIPWSGQEIADEYLPAETRQLERAVNYQKGCYLGQEVVERMRSRAVVARQLVGLRLDGSAVPPLKSQILDPDGKPVGHVTSSCHSPLLNCPIALAYVRTAPSTPGMRLTVSVEDQSTIPATVVNLPFTA